MKLRTGRGPLFALNIAAILTLFLYSSAGGFESAAIQACIAAWPAVPTSSIRLMLTLPALVQAVVMLLSAPLIGKRISFRAAAITGMLLITVGGVVPFFAHPNWAFVVAFRSIGLGCGGGLLGMRNALMLRSVPEDEAGRWVGAGTAAVAFMSVVCVPLAGALTELGWQYSFLVNLPALICLVLVTLFLREPREEAVQDPADEMPAEHIHAGKTVRMHPIAFAYAGILLLGTCVLYSAISGLSTYYSEEGIGSAALAGTAMSCYSIAGVAVNLALPRLQRMLGKHLVPVSLATCCAGVALTLFLPGKASSFCGMMLAGAGYFPVYSILQIYNGRMQPPEKLAFSSMLILMLNQLSIFLSGYFIEVCGKLLNFRGSEVSSAMLVGAAIFALTAIAMRFARICPEQRGDVPVQE